MKTYTRDFLFTLATAFLALASLNIMLFPEAPGYLGINPHPYLLGVLVMAARFGRGGAFAAAAVATLLLAVYLAAGLSPYFHWAVFSQGLFLTPTLSFFLLALFVGELRANGLARERELRQENAVLQDNNDSLHKQLETVMEIKEELESRLVGREDTIYSLYQATAFLETLDEAEFYQSLAKVAARFSGATKVSLFMLDYASGSLRCRAQYGSQMEGAASSYPIDAGIFGVVLKHNQILTIREIADTPDYLERWKSSGHRAYVYVPIALDSLTVAVLTVDDIPFLKLNLSSIRLLSMIAEFAIPALRNIIHVQDLEDMVRIDGLTGLPKPEAFLSAAQIEFQKAARYQLDFALIHVKIAGLAALHQRSDERTRTRILQKLGADFKNMQRSLDLIGLGATVEDFMIALPVTGTEGMLEVIDRLNRWFSGLRKDTPWAAGLRIHFGAANYHPSMRSFEQMLQRASQSLQINRRSRGAPGPRPGAAA